MSFNLGSLSTNLSSAPLPVAVNLSQKQRMMSRPAVYDVTPLQLLAALVQEEVKSKIYPYPVECFLDKCSMHHLNYVGLKIVKMEHYQAFKQHKKANLDMNSSALEWLKQHWKHQYEKTYNDVASDNDAVAIAENGEFKTFKAMSADGISDRIAMLQELRVLVECARSSAFELYSKSDKFTELDPPEQEDGKDVQGKKVPEP